MDDEELAEAIAVLAELDAEYGQYETSEERESGVGWAAWKTPPRREAEEDEEEEGTFWLLGNSQTQRARVRGDNHSRGADARRVQRDARRVF